jgi:hypothetical protein
MRGVWNCDEARRFDFVSAFLAQAESVIFHVIESGLDPGELGAVRPFNRQQDLIGLMCRRRVRPGTPQIRLHALHAIAKQDPAGEELLARIAQRVFAESFHGDMFP